MSDWTVYRLSAQRLERLTGQPVDGPVRHRLRAERTIEFDCAPVPVEGPPLKPPAAARERKLRQMPQQQLSVTLPSLLRTDIEILQVEPGPAKEGRITMKEQRKRDPFAVLLDKHNLGVFPCAEQRLAQGALCGLDLVRELLEPRELRDEAEDVRNVRVPRLDDSRLHRFYPGWRCRDPRSHGTTPLSKPAQKSEDRRHLPVAVCGLSRLTIITPNVSCPRKAGIQGRRAQDVYGSPRSHDAGNGRPSNSDDEGR